MDFKQLMTSLSKINRELKEQSISAVNISLTLRNWFFSFYILEFEQKGRDRAEYGKRLLASISKEMSNLHVSNSNERELGRFRQFYLAYPGAAKLFVSDTKIRSLLPSEAFDNHIKLSSNENRGLPNPEFNDNNIEIYNEVTINRVNTQFATAGMDDKIFVSQYLVALPHKQELEQFIKRELGSSTL